MFPKPNDCHCMSFIEEEDPKDQGHRMGMSLSTALGGWGVDGHTASAGSTSFHSLSVVRTLSFKIKQLNKQMIAL